MNQPFVAQRVMGKIDNFPKTGKYVSVFENRRERRATLSEPRHKGNNKGVSLVVLNLGKGQFVKYLKSFQVIGSSLNHNTETGVITFKPQITVCHTHEVINN
jgi:hypothetical protein